MTSVLLRRIALASAILVIVVAGYNVSPSEGVFSPQEVRQAFREHGLPLRAEPSGSPRTLTVARVFSSPRAGGVFSVEFYDAIATARLADNAPKFVTLTITTITDAEQPRDPTWPLGEVQQLRHANLLVFYDDGRPAVQRRLEAALAALGTP